jgi:acetyl esterase/lipase
VSHILHPHPTVEPVEVSGQFAGIALLSPWVTFDTNSDSMRANRISDVIAIPSLNKWASIFRGDAASDPYLEPLSAPENWWQSFPARNVLLLAGADEVFVDDIQHFAKQLGNAPPNVVLKIVPKEAHDHLVLEFMLKETRSKQREEFEKWIRDVVCTS